MTPEALEALYFRAFPTHRLWSAAEFEKLLASPGAILVGDARSAALGRVAADEAEILTLATDPQHRRKGLARARLAAFETEAADRGAATAFLEVAESNASARALYAAAGYAEVGRRPGYYTEPGGAATAALVLRKALAAKRPRTNL
ncbi:MAG: GNAT family N-acetyltransferase [Rhodobacteraceae bacterium]|nr:GNAT family N-acetyltransferase [Paracoccaceae bacterium]